MVVAVGFLVKVSIWDKVLLMIKFQGKLICGIVSKIIERLVFADLRYSLPDQFSRQDVALFWFSVLDWRCSFVYDFWLSFLLLSN